MRYTEVRLSPPALLLLDDVSDQIVRFRPTYDASNTEPSVLAASLPLLLLNGATGIAVGMATNVPPHNLREVVAACLAMVRDPAVDLATLMSHLPGPDFPTGGRILNSAEELEKIYANGRGAIDLRGEYRVEQEGRRQRLVITSIPYGVNKSQLVEKIADHIGSGKLPQVVDVRDESAEDVRVVLDLRSGAEPEAAAAYLFKHTPLQNRFHVNLTCLVPVNDEVMAPAQLGLASVLRHFLDFRFSVVTRRLEVQLAELQARIHLLEGFVRVFDGLDDAVALIRGSKDRPTALAGLCARFDLDEAQATAVLELRLYKLAQLEIDKIVSELRSKQAEAAHISSLLADDGARWRLLETELVSLGERFGDARRTTLGGPDVALSYTKENYIVDEDVFVVVTRDGWIKRQRRFSDVASVRVREGDEVGWVLWGSTLRSLVVCSDRGKAYTLRVDSVPATSGYGDPIQAHFDFEDGERVVAALIVDVRCLPPLHNGRGGAQSGLPFVEGEESEAEGAAVHTLVAVSLYGQVLRMRLESYENVSTKAGRLLMRLPSGSEDRVVAVEVSGGGEEVCMLTQATRVLVFSVEQVPLLKSAGKGVRGIGLDRGDVMVGFGLSRDPQAGVLAHLSSGREIMVCPRRFPSAARGGRGRLILRRGRVERVAKSLDVPVQPVPSE